MKITEIPAQICPECGFKMTATTEAHGSTEPPRPGDVSICFGCNSIHVFGNDMTLRMPTPEQSREYGLLPEVMRAQMGRLAAGMPPLRKRHVPKKLH
jgi:hypothetical protein